MIDKANRLWHWAYDPIDAAPMAALRIACGLLTIGWAVSLLPDAQAFLTSTGVQPKAVPTHNGFWTVSIGNPYLTIGILIAAAVALTVGWHTRIASVFVWFLLIAIQRRDVYVLNSGDLLLRELAFYVALMPSGEVWSLDARRRGFSEDRVPWGLRLMQLQLSIVYFFSVIAKLHGDSWQNGTAVGKALQLKDLQRIALPQQFDTSVWASAAMTYGTLFAEGFLVFGLWRASTRKAAILTGLAVHLGIEATLLIGWFSLTILSCYFAFVPGEDLRKGVDRVRDRFGRGGGERPAEEPPADPVVEPGPPDPAQVDETTGTYA